MLSASVTEPLMSQRKPRFSVNRLLTRQSSWIQGAASELPAVLNETAAAVVVLVEDVGRPDIQTRADVVLAAGQRHVRLQRVVAGAVRRVAARQGDELIDLEL